jgi:acetyltransferase-like isoleucine patch superfamily enzyme
LKKYIFVFLGAIHLLTLTFIIDAVFPTLNLISDALLGSILDFLDALFYRSVLGILLSLLIAFSVNLFVFIIGYSLCPKHRVGGTLTYMFSLILDLILITVALLFSFFGTIFSKELTSSFKLILAIAYFPLLMGLLFFVSGKIADTSFFFSDVLKERKEYGKLRYSIEKNGRLTYIRIDTSNSTVDCILTAAPTLLIEQALLDIGKTDSISVFLKSALVNFFLHLFARTTAWPRARVFFFRKLTGAEIGKNCLIGQWTMFDPILPDLINFEEDCGVGIGSTVLTHSYMGVNRMTFVFGPVKICRYARVGAHCVILPGVTIGEGAVVAAGSVVAEDVPPYAFAVGAPAKIQERRRKEQMN